MNEPMAHEGTMMQLHLRPQYPRPKRPRKRPYVGIKFRNAEALPSIRTVFNSFDTPTPASGYDAVIGPFRTKHAAEFMADCGNNNPHLQTVADAERIAKQYHKVTVWERV